MRIIILIVVLKVLTISYSYSQEIVEKKFYKNKYGEPAATEKQAKIVELVIKEPDSTMRYEMRMMKDNSLLRARNYKNGVPVGKWLTTSGLEIDYDFDLKYLNTDYPNVIIYDLTAKALITPINEIFEAPLFQNNAQSVLQFLSSNIIYPELAQENGIQGTVYTQFIIDEEGKLVNLAIRKGAHKILDKEAARVVRLMTQWQPARVNEKAVSVCIKLPIRFQLSN